MSKKLFYENGLKFECQGSGKCCSSRGAYGYVYLTKTDRKNISELLDMPMASFTKKYCRKVEDIYCLKEEFFPDGEINPDCRYLEGTRCKIYKARPTQCRTWPFWPENMTPRAWNKNVVSFCPGVNKGKKFSKNQVEKIMAEDKSVDLELLKLT